MQALEEWIQDTGGQIDIRSGGIVTRIRVHLRWSTKWSESKATTGVGSTLAEAAARALERYKSCR